MYRFHHWRLQIEDARDERALARVMHDYRLTLPAAMVESLPCEYRGSLDARDIPGAALTLLQAELKRNGDAPGSPDLLHEVSRTYAAAAVKMAGWKGRK